MAGGGGGTEELNLVPYLDIMVNLIMFMLVVVAYIVELREAPILAPSYGEKGGGGGEQKPFLTVAITAGAYKLVGGGGAEGKSADIPVGDVKQLGAQLRAVKTAIPNVSENLVITASANVPYKEVVRVMDAARADSAGSLFPAVTLAATVQ